MSYNGWSNWETWNVALWVDNEYAIYQARMESKPKTVEEVKAFVLEWFPNGTPDFQELEWHDARAAVNWRDIADSWAAEYEDE